MRGKQKKCDAVYKALKKENAQLDRKLISRTQIPQHTVESIARCILPDIQAYYESEEGQREFAQWKARREAESLQKKEA